jgi:hypothetical protein
MGGHAIPTITAGAAMLTAIAIFCVMAYGLGGDLGVFARSSGDPSKPVAVVASRIRPEPGLWGRSCGDLMTSTDIVSVRMAQ